MKTKIVLWGENEKDEKILLGIELLDANNIIRIHNIPEKEATELFYNQMMNQWREGQKVSMPESTEVIDRPLSMTEGLLPDNIKTDRQDILARAKTEWHFVILSSKLYESYADEVAQIKERVKDLTDFDQGMWEEMKSFWKKVQNQVQEKNLFREHATELRSKTNEIFDSLKSLKKSMNDEFEGLSKGHFDKFTAIVDDIEARIEKGLGLQPIFNELKGVQADFKNYKFTRKHQNDIWNRIDGAFKKVKEKKFGSKASGGNNPVNRLTRRLEGLQSAIGKMEQSIGRDTRDKQFQIKRIDTTDGQLELQIRQAKMAMIEERIKSKQVKLDDMLSTRVELESKIASAQKKEEAREAKQAQAKAVKQAKKTIKEDIAKDITERSESLKEKEDKLKKAAESIKEAKAKKKKSVTPPPVPVSVESKVKEVLPEAEVVKEVVSEKVVVAEEVDAKLTESVAEAIVPVAPIVEAAAPGIVSEKIVVAEEVKTSTEKVAEVIVEETPPSAEAVLEEVKVAEVDEVVKSEVVSEITEEIKAIAEEEE